METNKTFFSYSRTDSDFTLKLAKDLREAGVPIWLDQLDIAAGSRWDASIEAALASAGRLIVILTPESVASVNVMDEVAYALENNITIIPVLLTECKTPFRISRLQRIDFTGDYNTGLANLLHALGLPGKETTPIPENLEKPASTASAEPGVVHSKMAGLSTESAGAQIPQKSSSTKFLLIGGGLVLLILIIWGISSTGSGDTENYHPETAVESVEMNPDLHEGDAYEGGIIYEIDSSGEHGLIAASQDLGDNYTFDEALQACEDLEIDGYSDWYLPNKLELRKLYLKRDVVGGFEGIDYWSSSEDPENENMAYGLRFDIEGVSYGAKEEGGAVRAIRKF